MEYQYIYPFIFGDSQSSSSPSSRSCSRQSTTTGAQQSHCQRKSQQTPTTPSSWSPRIEIAETETEFIISAELAGVKKEDINLNIEKDVLTISGDKKQVVYESKAQLEETIESSPPVPSTTENDESDSDVELPTVEEDFEDLTPSSSSSNKVSPSPSTDSNNNNNSSKSIPVVTNNEKKESKSTTQYHRREISYGKFSRSFELTDNLELELITAKHNDGVLQITVPKKKQLPPKHIKINIH
ncbi:heat shock protein Hsp20 domain-containing protein [Cavenderia fasciculata]|uniref:Heat shock protein Hsp20 domain-containing protein n=1 Tax=Cavenderia fasciculata TaxID=261658 RepID=F4Q120_CACFS|nr:heat shock protein Hsp20 domain-containing protein [Cavenderia fasciculata]EGG18521.1 heat shock protein Hsp20 domain-containing protein [Cavenderia fasciculata]|eukprot:XP_004366425.1 heat shock protein Hsp20 domain-containing protein [Cavenderia fasciculata]